MTHHVQTTALEPFAELLAEQGFDGLADALRVLLNEVTKIERAAMLNAASDSRAEGRTGYANGFKPRTLPTQLGEMTVAMPETRGVDFYPSAVEKGLISTFRTSPTCCKATGAVGTKPAPTSGKPSIASGSR